MINKAIQFILVILCIFTPIAFGSVELWAFSLMELGILSIIILWAIQNLVQSSELGARSFRFEILFISLFSILVIFQLIPFPPGIVKILSPKTYEIRQSLADAIPQSGIRNSQFLLSLLLLRSNFINGSR